MFDMKSRFLGAVAVALAVLGAAPGTGEAQGTAPRAVVSIQPLHSLVAAVMAGIGEPALLVRGAGSPHDHSLSPAEARALSRADMVVWVGAVLETSLARPIAALAGKARVLEVMEVPGVTVIEGGDGHIWLDPRNAGAIARAAAWNLARIDPANAAGYRANAAALGARLRDLEAELARVLAPVRAAPYVTFHDAYGYFERRFALNPVGAIAIGPARAPGAKRIAKMRRRLRESGALCVFAEPQFEPALARTLVEGTEARIGVLDPLGADLAPGPTAYFTLLRALAQSLRACLGAGS